MDQADQEVAPQRQRARLRVGDVAELADHLLDALARVSSLSSGERLITRLTVFFDTPAIRATSLIVGWPVFCIGDGIAAAPRRRR